MGCLLTLHVRSISVSVLPCRYKHTAELRAKNFTFILDYLQISLNSVRSSEVKVGIDDLLDVTVSMENREENSYNTRVILTYPAGLSYRKFTILKVKCRINSGSAHLCSAHFALHTADTVGLCVCSMFFSLSLIKGRIECNSLDSEGGSLRGKTECTVDRPIFKSSSKV